LWLVTIPSYIDSEGSAEQGAVPHKCPPGPVQKDLERNFKLRVDRKDKPSMEEVE